MSLWNLLILIATGSSLVLLFQRILVAVAALIASGLQALIAFGVLSPSSLGAPPPGIFAGILLGVGIFAFLKSSNKLVIAAAAVLTTVGGIQLLTLYEVI